MPLVASGCLDKKVLKGVDRMVNGLAVAAHEDKAGDPGALASFAHACVASPEALTAQLEPPETIGAQAIDSGLKEQKIRGVLKGSVQSALDHLEVDVIAGALIDW